MTEPARVVHVVKGLEANSGVAVFVSELAREQAAAGTNVTVLCDYRPELAPPPLVRLAVGRPLSSAAARRGDWVHIHALWSLFCLRALLFCRLRGIRYVVSPHGSLMPRVFSHGRLKKAFVWRLLLRPLVRRAELVHCTSEAEADACRALGIDGPFVVAPLGVRLPERIDQPEAKGKGYVALFLGRLGEEKGLFTLMDAWERVRPAGWRLRLAGPDWDGLAAKLRRRAAAFADSVEFVGAAGPEAKDRLYREADIFVLPSPMENFSAVVLEALAYATPVICTTGTPWQAVEERRCGWRVEPDSVAALAAALAAATSISDAERAEMGARGRELAAERFSWQGVAKRITEAMAGSVVDGKFSNWTPKLSARNARRSS